MIAGTAIGYFVGTFPSADLVSRLATRGEVDLRTQGSGNPGGLNAARVLGKKWGALVILLDTIKGAVAGLLGLAIGGAPAYAAGTAAIAGHCWPIWSRFRGGRGVAAAGGSLASVFPPMFAIEAVVASGLALLTRNSVKTVRVAVAVWVIGAAVWWAADLSNWWGPDVATGLFVYAVLGSGMLMVKFATRARDGSASL